MGKIKKYVEVGVTRKRTLDGKFHPSPAAFVNEDDFNLGYLSQDTKQGLCGLNYSDGAKDESHSIFTPSYNQSMIECGFVMFRKPREDGKLSYETEAVMPLYKVVDGRKERSGFHKVEEALLDDLAQFFGKAYKDEQRKKN